MIRSIQLCIDLNRSIQDNNFSKLTFFKINNCLMHNTIVFSQPTHKCKYEFKKKIVHSEISNRSRGLVALV